MKKADDNDETILNLDFSDNFGFTYYTDTKVCSRLYIGQKVDEGESNGHRDLAVNGSEDKHTSNNSVVRRVAVDPALVLCSGRRLNMSTVTESSLPFLITRFPTRPPTSPPTPLPTPTPTLTPPPTRCIAPSTGYPTNAPSTTIPPYAGGIIWCPGNPYGYCNCERDCLNDADQTKFCNCAEGKQCCTATAEPTTTKSPTNPPTVSTACVKNVGTFDAQKDYCFVCRSSFGYCWNSPNPPCPPACDEVRFVDVKGNANCGDPCDQFMDKYGFAYVNFYVL